MTKIIFIILLALTSMPCRSQTLSLEPSNFKEISFDGIPPTQYSYSKGILTAHVQRSSSFLLKSFANIKSIKSVHVEWTFLGELKIKDLSHEEDKDGDDSKLRIALLLSGKAPAIPFFSPAWIRKTKNHLSHSSNRMLYLTFGAHHPPGRTWESPYSSSIQHISISSKKTPDGWLESSYTFEKPQKVVGFWILADGDNTESSFTTKIRRLIFQP